jgi:hypothetical protein
MSYFFSRFSSVLGQKRQFLPILWRKYFKNQIIGPRFLSKLIHHFYRGKSSPKNMISFSIKKKLPEESNRPIGEM